MKFINCPHCQTLNVLTPTDAIDKHKCTQCGKLLTATIDTTHKSKANQTVAAPIKHTKPPVLLNAFSTNFAPISVKTPVLLFLGAALIVSLFLIITNSTKKTSNQFPSGQSPSLSDEERFLFRQQMQADQAEEMLIQQELANRRAYQDRITSMTNKPTKCQWCGREYIPPRFSGELYGLGYCSERCRFEAKQSR